MYIAINSGCTSQSTAAGKLICEGKVCGKEAFVYCDFKEVRVVVHTLNFSRLQVTLLIDKQLGYFFIHFPEYQSSFVTFKTVQMIMRLQYDDICTTVQ